MESLNLVSNKRIASRVCLMLGLRTVISESFLIERIKQNRLALGWAGGRESNRRSSLVSEIDMTATSSAALSSWVLTISMIKKQRKQTGQLVSIPPQDGSSSGTVMYTFLWLWLCLPLGILGPSVYYITNLCLAILKSTFPNPPTPKVLSTTFCTTQS